MWILGTYPESTSAARKKLPCVKLSPIICAYTSLSPTPFLPTLSLEERCLTTLNSSPFTRSTCSTSPSAGLEIVATWFSLRMNAPLFFMLNRTKSL